MLYGMLAATELLNGFAILGWICHSDALSSLVISALKKVELCSRQGPEIDKDAGQILAKKKNMDIKELNKK